MKKLSSIFFVKYLLIGIYSLSFVNLNAQTCDENVLKGLENTRIYYHKEVTKGSNASFFIKNPLKGTTYSFIDKATDVAYSKLYTGVPEELTIEIPVGKVTTEQYFLFRATNGDCAYQSSDHRDVNKRYYVITPDTQTKLSLSVEHEWCAHSGAVHINMVGDDNAHYNFFFKKPNGNFEQLANHSYTSLDAGTYEVKAVNKNDSSKVYTKKVEVEKFTKNIDFQLSSVVDVCTGKLAIYVDTQKGKTGVTADNSYPLFFTLLKNNVEIKNQTSPLFKDVEEGATYEVRVYDVCGTSGGNFSTQTYKVTKRLGVFKVTNHSGFSPKANCPYMVSFTSELYVKDAREMVEKNLIPYPLTFTFEMTSPSNKVYHFSFVVNNKQELEENFTPTENSFSLRPLKLSNNNIPYESGKWKLKGTYTICGKQDVISETEKEVFLPITGVGIGTAQDDLATGCRNQKLVLTNSNNLQPLKNFYTVLENAPAGFDYQAAGFYKITTTNPLLQNKWVKFFENTDGRKTLLPAKFVEEGGDYKFKVVDECTNTTKDLSYTGYATSQGLFELKAKVYATCSDPSGAPDNNSLWKEVVLERGNTTDGTITKVEIISYEKDSRFADYSALMPVALPIDITETYRSGEQQWRIKLPAGVYNVRWSGSCNKTGTLKVQTGGTENTTFEWQDGCNPKLIVKRNTSYSLTQGIEYILERYDTKENRWVSVTYGYYGGDTYLDARRDRFEFNIPNPQQGKYRVLRSIQPDSRNRFKECTRVVAEHEFTEGEMQQPKGVRMDCSAIGGAQKYHIAIIPQGGVPPYTYELSEAEIDGSTTNAVYQNNSDNNFFINIDASKPQARYKFLVKDSCGKGKVYEETLSQIAPFAVQKNQEFYCVGSKGVLSVPQISGVSYQWYRNDQPTTVLSTSNELVINNLTQDDLDNSFSLKLTLTNITDPKVKSCIEQNLNGFDTIRFNTHTPYSQTYKAPIAVNRVECLGETNNSVNNIYDVNKLFKDVPTSFEAGVSYDIIDKDGLISTTRMDYLGVKDMIKMSPALVGKHTFIYRIKSACGSVITQTEATLEVKTYRQIYATSINVCEATKTLAELETIIKNTNTGITTSMFGNDFEFQWYPTSEDANKETNRITTPSLSLSEGNNQYYIKGKHIGDSFCFSSPAQVNIMRLSSSSKGDKTITLCEGTTITDLKKEIAKPSTSDVNKVAVYKGTTLLSNDDVLQTGIQYTYTYKVGTCETPSANINLTLTPITPIPPVESLVVCDYEVENLSYYTTYAVVMNYLQTKYAGKTVKLYQSFGPYNIPQVQPTDKVFLNNDRFSYTLQEAGKCESVRQKIIVVADINRAIATTVAISVCEEDKVSAIRAKLIGDNIKIYKKLRISSQNAVLSTEVNDNEDIDWTEGIEYFYTVKKPGDTCESRKERIFLSKSLGGKTLAQPASLSLCKSSATIADLKVALQGNETKIYTLNPQNKYVEEIDTTVLNATTAYYYTLRDVGKCVSDKAPVIFALLQRPAPPTVTQTTHTLCSGTNQTIASLQPQGANIVWYATATDVTPLAKTTPLVAGTTYYVAQKNGTCESDRVAVAVTQGASGNETLNFQATNNSLNCIPTGQLRFQIQSPVAGKTYVVELVEMPATYTGTRTFTITESDKEGAVSFVKVTGYNMSAGSYKARLISCNTSVPVPVTIHTLQRDFPTPDRNTNDFGRDQPYRSILDASGNKDCNYLDIRYDGRNTNSPLYKYFNTPELLALYEYTAYSDYDLQHIYGGDKNNPNIQWRPVFSVPAGKTVANNVKMVYYDLGAHHRTYKDLQTDPTKRPNFYFRIKGHNSCNNQADPMLIGDMRFMGANVNFEGTCTAPKMSVKLFNPMFCDPATYVVKEKATGIQVATGSIKQDETKDLSVLNGGVPFDKSKEYEIVLTSVDGQVITKTGSFDDYYNSRIPQAGFTIATRCFGSPNNTKGYIEMIFREMKSQNIYSVNGYKVTLESAPAGYTEEPGKLKIGETVTITYRNPNSSTNNILAVPYQDDLNKNFTLPEGIYKIKLEDPCGKVIYLRNTRNPIANDKFQLTYPTDYQEKPLTPETRTECARVNVYPFKGNPAMDWLKAGNRNRNVYVYLYKRPNGINAGDVTVSSGLSRQIGGTVYIKAVYDPNNPASADQYFSLPRNQNSEGSYTFVYGGKVDAISSSENDVVDYISSNGTNGCVRTFTISVDDVLLNFDRNGYIGYKCEDNTGKIVVKAINGIGGSGTYQYELYDRRNGTRIDTKTAPKGSTVTFTNLGTFTGGQNSRWVKITDSACASDPVWKELPITPLNNPQLLLVNPLKDAYCKGETVSITLHSLGAPAYQWTFPNGNVVTTTIPQLVIPSIDAQHAGVYRVVAQGLTCAANTVTFNYNVRILEKPANGKTYTFCAAATVAELKAKVATDTNSLKVYKNGTLVTNNNEALSATAAYTVSRFNATCETDKVAVTVTISNTVSLTVPATLTVTCTAANIDATVNNWLGQATVTDTCGTATLTHNYTTVKPTNWCNTSVVTVTFVGKDPQGNTVTKTSVIKVNSTPIVAKADTYTVTNGTNTTTTTGTVLDNDKLGTKTPTTTDVILTVVTTTTDVVDATKTPTLNNDGTITVPSGTKSGTYGIVYSICERLNPNNCATTTATVKVGSTPIVAKADTYTVTNGTSTTTTTGTVLDNDKLGTKTPTTTDVILTVVTTTTDVVGATKTPTLNNDGTVTVPSGTKSGTYEIVYSICERLNPNNCATATATVKVGSTPIVAKADTYTITNGTSTTTTTGTVLDNDKLGTKTPTTTDVILTVVTTTTDVVGATKTPTLNNDGTVTVPSGTKSGNYEIVYSICERLNPNNCATATATVKVGSTPIVAKVDTYTITNGTSTTTTTGTVLDNDKLGTKTPTTADVILTVVTTTTDVVGATKTPTLNNDGTVTVPSGTKSGTYEIVYSICERLNPDNCATATATVKVFVPAVATPTTIEAVNDGVTTITSTTGGTTPSVLTNDKLNGVPNPSISSVTLTWNTATPTGFTLNPNGTISVAPNTPAGTHTISYTICAVASPTVCSTASIVVTVSGTTTSTTPVLPIAVDDRSTTAINTPVVVNVLGNDTPNGATTPNVVTNPANGTVVVNLDGSIEYRPNTGFEGTDTFVYEICNTGGCASATVTIDVVNKLVPYNGMSVDGDGKNDYFHIGGIERYPNNVVRIYNRWGVKVFETEGYDNVTRVFRGFSNGRVTVEQAEKLPQGTYYYVIEYYDSNNNKESLVGWLYLKK